ncbi:MAG: M3 family metallopeptidase [Bacteroidales bacterium]|jgi:peptidyl-dipeptidase Dcp|nr:M3 family metallopeptidase [Bacteroidales bacterium]
MKAYLIIIVFFAVVLNSCNQEESGGNPFFSTFNTPFEVPPFDRIKPEHYKPAYLKGFEEQNRKIDEIINNQADPTFNNTIRELEYSGELLRKVSRVFGAVNSANTSDTLQAINREITPLYTKHRDNINLNNQLFQKISRVYENKSQFRLTEEEEKVLDDTYRRFVRNGAALSDSDKVRLRQINEELSLLSVKFGENLLAETNDFKLVIENKNDLSGLPEGVIAQAQTLAESHNMDGKWLFSLQVPSMVPFLQYSDKRELREKIYSAYFKRGDNDNSRDNKQIVEKIARLRAERSSLLGYSNHASYVLEENMAKTPERVFDFLEQVWEAALPVAKAEASEQQKLIDKEGGNFKLSPWDWWFYSEKIKKEKYELDDEIIRPYFMIENVINGMFYVANRLYGLEFQQRTDIPKYHPDVLTFEVKRGKTHIGVLMIDNYPRASKRGGAWCGAYRGQSRDYKGKMIHPVVTIVTNSTPPSADKPSLLTAEEASTLFHEFGHALHQLLSNVTYPSMSGTSVPRDFVELPSQIMEHWVLKPEVLNVYAKHYITGEVIPGEIVDKLEKSAIFNTGFATVEFLAAALLDMEYHTISQSREIDARQFESEILDKYGLIPEIKPRYRSTYFNHIWAGGYASGYYSYYWSEMLDADAFQAFKETGDIFNRDIAAKFENEILSRGGTRDPLDMYIAFRGKEPGINALLQNRGLK